MHLAFPGLRPSGLNEAPAIRLQLRGQQRLCRNDPAHRFPLDPVSGNPSRRRLYAPSRRSASAARLNQKQQPLVYPLQRVFRYNDNSRRFRKEHDMKILSLKGAPLPLRRQEERLPPGSGLVITAALSVLIWGSVAAAAFLT